MKRFLGIFAVAFAIAGICTAAVFTNGWGKKVTAAATPTIVAVPSLNTVSVYNSGTGDAYLLANSTTNTLTNAVAQSTAVVVPGNSSFTFDYAAKAALTSLGYQIQAGYTNTLYISGY